MLANDLLSSILEDQSTLSFISLEGLKELSVTQFIDEASSLVASLAITNNIDISMIRSIDESMVENLLTALKANNSTALMIMRHGSQNLGEQIFNMGAAEKKIIMMQKEHNTTDGITLESAFEFVASIFIFSFLRAKTGCKFEVESSNNLRAVQPAEALKKALGCQLKFFEQWDCVNYPEDNILAENDRASFLKDGAVPWTKKAIDTVIGDGTYDTIQQNVKFALQRSIPSKTIRIIITHTQQINAACQAKGHPAARLGNYGFVAVFGNISSFMESQKKRPCIMAKNGTYSDTLLGSNHTNKCNL